MAFSRLKKLGFMGFFVAKTTLDQRFLNYIIHETPSYFKGVSVTMELFSMILHFIHIEAVRSSCTPRQAYATYQGVQSG